MFSILIRLIYIMTSNSNDKTPAVDSSSSNTPKKKRNSIQVELSEKSNKIYPRKVTGIYAFYRKLGVYLLLGMFYLTVWVTIDGDQAVLWDLPNRKFHVFGLIFWPQDLIYLAALLIVSAFLLFFITALAGRVWCGYACPQTVWTEVFLWIERFVEGDRAKQMKLDAGGLTRQKLTKKIIKHFLWITLSLWTGFTFVGYFSDIRILFSSVLEFSLGPWETFWILFYGFATYGNAGWLREQICLHMCPYARFQSVMFDNDTMVISYDKARGEPRGSRRRSENPVELNLGSCIDCSLCVQVCPTGIDIRDGLQYECIGCSACIDVCDSVMDKMNYPRGLIRYTTENALQGKPSKILRPRIIIYFVILVAILAGVAFSLINKAPASFDVSRDRGVMFREVGVADIENIYQIRVINKSNIEQTYQLSVAGIDNVKIIKDTDVWTLAPGEGENFVVLLRANKKDLIEKNTDITFNLLVQQENNDNVFSDQTKSRFLRPD